MTENHNRLAEYVREIEPQCLTQRSTEWYAMRGKIIGGSEIASVIGKGFGGKGRDALLREKLGISAKFAGNNYTQWGVLFEPLSREFTERILLMPEPILEIGSMPTPIDFLRYSPDGVGVAELNLTSSNNKKCYIILFEFKSPWGSIPECKVPEYYRPQVLTGLMAIEMCDIGLFVNNMFRRCPLSEVSLANQTTRKYDAIYHNDAAAHKRAPLRRLNARHSGALAAGIILFVIIPEMLTRLEEYRAQLSNHDADMCESFEQINLFSHARDHALLSEKKELIDFGACAADQFNRALALFDAKILHADYVRMNIFSETAAVIPLANIRETVDHTVDLQSHLDAAISAQMQTGALCVGYLPYKLLGSDVLSVSRDANWRATVEPKVRETIKMLHECSAAANPANKLDELMNLNLPQNDELEESIANIASLTFLDSLETD